MLSAAAEKCGKIERIDQHLIRFNVTAAKFKPVNIRNLLSIKPGLGQPVPVSGSVYFNPNLNMMPVSSGNMDLTFGKPPNSIRFSDIYALRSMREIESISPFTDLVLVIDIQLD